MTFRCANCQRELPTTSEPGVYCSFCGKPLLPETEAFESSAPSSAFRLTEPDTIGGFRLLKKLGAGGMGAVYEAVDARTGRRVAVKLIAPQFAASADAVERFRQEGRLASAIAHPRCVFVFAADEEAGRPYIVMELMPGDTLKDLVEREGPLSPPEAVAKILDVIDGLREAHDLAVIHRDVKPTNCFLEAGGRVKIGDFGLSKSLVGDTQLTQSGAFLGTLLFAAPEQIRGEVTDHQSDVYSVAATLHYLLTGKAPFQASTPAATLASIVADPLTPIRRLRPELPASLEAALLRGLARSKERRFRSLDEFRAALLPLAGSLPNAGIGWRLGAYAIDAALFLPLTMLVEADPTWPNRWVPTEQIKTLIVLAGQLPWVVYFWLTEGLSGWSLGKRILRLRVVVSGGDPPGLLRAGWRTLVFIAFTALVPALIDWGANPFGTEDFTHWDLFYVAALLLGPLLLMSLRLFDRCAPALHDAAAGTSVVHWPQPQPQQMADALRELDATPAGETNAVEAAPARVGPFIVERRLRSDQPQILLARDPVLRRRVWVQLHQPTEYRVSDARRQVARPTRMRWLAGGEIESENGEPLRWEAFAAAAGIPLTRLAFDRRRPGWRQARHVLEQLAEELSVSLEDGTLPASISPEQVVVQPSGRLQLLDVPLSDHQPDAATNEDPDQRAAELLGSAARLLVGEEPMPLHARAIVQRLLRSNSQLPQPREVLADLQTTRDLPVEVTAGMRAGQLALAVMFLFIGLLTMFGLSLSFAGLRMATAVEELESHERALSVLKAGRLDQFIQTHLGSQQELTLNPPVYFAGRTWSQISRDELRLALMDPARVALLEHTLLTHQANLRSRLSELNLVDRWIWSSEVERARRLLTPGHKVDASKTDLPELLGTLETLELGVLMPLLDWIPLATILLVIAAFSAACMGWALVARAGLSYRLMGLELVNRRGQLASRWRCAWRALLVWTPVAVLLALGPVLSKIAPNTGNLTVACSGLAALILGVYVLLAIRFPARTPLDWMAGTRVVTK